MLRGLRQRRHRYLINLPLQVVTSNQLQAVILDQVTSDQRQVVT